MDKDDKAKKDKDKTAKKKAGGQVKPLAAVQRLQLTGSGGLRVWLRCPPKSARTCSATGTIVAGTSLGKVIPKTTLRFDVVPVTVVNGKTLKREFKLTDAQLAELHELSEVNFQVRLALPSAKQGIREVFIRTRVPAELRA